MIYLCSTSPYRQQLLKKLHLPFETLSPQVDETPLANESPNALIKRLSIGKAKAGLQQRLALAGASQAAKTNGYDVNTTQSVFIGSDQMALCQGELLGKPGNYDSAIEQLSKLSGQRVTFLTGIALVQSAAESDAPDSSHCLYQCDETIVDMRELSAAEIQRYVEIDQPYRSAGSFKSEGYGITLFKSITSQDPNALIGLPLIRLCQMLESVGIAVLSPPISYQESLL